MCGIAGILFKDGRKVDEGLLAEFIRPLRFRGPDAHGYFIKDNTGIAHTRLSILDLSRAANQPMLDDTNTKVVVFNGEMYNFQTVKEELRSKGVTFNTTSDTEVILKSCQHSGIEKTALNIDGMFSFAYLDTEKNSLSIARDRLGKKPLYYYDSPALFAFSSEITSFYTFSEIKLSQNTDALTYYFQQLCLPQPFTIWNEIKQVENGGVIKVDLSNGTIQKNHYFHLNNFFTKQKLDKTEIIEETERKLKSAIKKRLVADVPIGFFLSGGIDSALMVSLASEITDKPVHTFSVGFSSNDANELPEAKFVSEKMNTKHTELFVEQNIIDLLPELIDYLGEPFADSSILPTYLISKKISSQIKVAISGDGGDELFGGYGNYLAAYKADALKQKVPGQIARKLSWVASNAKRKIGITDTGASNMEHAFLEMRSLEKVYNYTAFSSQEIGKLISNSNKNSFSQNYVESRWNELYNGSEVQTLMKLSLSTRLQNDYLVKLDRMSMYSSLEIRSPFLDDELVSFAFSIPADQLFETNTPKYILRKLAEKKLGSAYAWKKKKGFAIPLEAWLKSDLRPIVDAYFEEYLAGKDEILNKGYIKIIKSQFYLQGNKALAEKIWVLLCYFIWLRSHKKYIS